MDCRNTRAVKRKQKMEANGGSHTNSQWEALLSKSPNCAVCARPWCEVAARRDSRYKYVWTKGHIRPVYHGGSDDILNIQAECYPCNFKKNAGNLKRDTV
ncbi:HNH endonuclease [Roseateles koreensis]|uniref:HNH endonuclease n=1 Tax=Roseateles koreensis TaxID=2987526 RepID=UPI0039648C57